MHVNRRRSCQKRFADACRGIGCARQPWRTHPHGLEGHGPVRVACAEQVVRDDTVPRSCTRNRDLETRRHDIALYTGRKFYEERSTDHPSAVTICRRSVSRPLVDMAVHRSVDIDLAASGVDGQEDPANPWSNGNRGEHGERKLSIAAREPLPPRGRTLDRQSLSRKNEVTLKNDWRRVERFTGESLICHLIPVSVVCLPQPGWRRHRSIDRHHDVVVHMLHRNVCRDWRNLPSVWHAEAEATCVEADVERIQQPSMDAHPLPGVACARSATHSTSNPRHPRIASSKLAICNRAVDRVPGCHRPVSAIDEVSPALRRADPRPPSGYLDEGATGPHRPW